MMIKLGGRCTVQKSRPSSNVGVIAPRVRIVQNVAFGYDVGKISAGCLVLFYSVNAMYFTGCITAHVTEASICCQNWGKLGMCIFIPCFSFPVISSLPRRLLKTKMNIRDIKQNIDGENDIFTVNYCGVQPCKLILQHEESRLIECVPP